MIKGDDLNKGLFERQSLEKNIWKAYKRITLFPYEYLLAFYSETAIPNQSKIKLLEGSIQDV